MPNQPTAKNELKTKRKTAAAMPEALLTCEVVPARIAMEICKPVVSQLSTAAKRACTTHSLTRSAEEHQLPSTELFDGEDGDPAGDEVLRAVERGQQSTRKATEPDVVLEDRGGVVCDDLDYLPQLEQGLVLERR